jgi:hypothetical protein
LRRASLFVLAAFLLVSTNASAQETTHGGVPTDLGPPRTDALVDPSMARSWAEGTPRTFAAVAIDGGYLYLRPRGMIGYGKPFQTWIGVEANPIVSSAGFGGYGGARFALPFIDLRVGARYFNTFRRAFLVPKDSYDRLDLDATDQPRSRYVTLEAELSAAVPLGPGDFLALASVSSMVGVKPGTYVFEETLRVIVDPPYVWRGRLGYAFRFGAHGQFSLGPVVDVLHVPQRDDSLTVRTGPVMRVQLSRHFDVRGSFVTTVYSPDRLGLVGGDFTELGVRYRTATE